MKAIAAARKKAIAEPHAAASTTAYMNVTPNSAKHSAAATGRSTFPALYMAFLKAIAVFSFFISIAV